MSLNKIGMDKDIRIDKIIDIDKNLDIYNKKQLAKSYIKQDHLIYQLI